LPLYALLKQRLAAGDIGRVHAIQSSFCFAVPFNAESRVFNPALAGGTLLDIGIYNLAATRWVLQAALGHCPEPTRMHATGTLAPTGVDQRVTATLEFPQGITSQFTCAFDSVSDNALHIFGSEGTITVGQAFWQGTEATLQRPGLAPELLRAPFAINGFEGEIEEAMRCVRAGLQQSPGMPQTETLATLSWLDELRRQLGVRYPFETKETAL
jgi:predicted dehydrogenase